MSMNDFINMLNDEQKQALLKALTSNTTTMSHVPEEVKQESINHIQSSKKEAVVNPDFSMFKQNGNDSNQRRKEQVKARRNDWVDDGEFRDIETPKGERSPRTRPQHQKKEVDCSVCGRSFKIDPKYVYGEYHRCSRCVGK